MPRPLRQHHPDGVATFSFKFTDPRPASSAPAGSASINPETFTVEDARSKVYGLKARIGAGGVAETFRDRQGAAGQAWQDRR